MIDSFIPDNIDKAQWHFTGEGEDVFGVREGVKVVEKFALVKRRPDGSFDWSIAGTAFQGREPNRERAIDKVNSLFLSAMEMKESLS